VLLNEAIVAAIGRATNRRNDRVASCKHRIINNSGGGWRVRSVMRHEGKERDRWLTVACQTKHRHQPSCKFLPP